MLGLFVNTLTADYKYSLLNRGYLLRHVQMQLSQKRKTFSNFFIYLFIFFTFSEFKLNLEHNQKRKILIADVFSNLGTPKNVVSKMSKKSHFRGLFEK